MEGNFQFPNERLRQQQMNWHILTEVRRAFPADISVQANGFWSLKEGWEFVHLGTVGACSVLLWCLYCALVTSTRMLLLRKSCQSLNQDRIEAAKIDGIEVGRMNWRRCRLSRAGVCSWPASVSLCSWLWVCPVPAEQYDGSNIVWLTHVHGKCDFSRGFSMLFLLCSPKTRLCFYLVFSPEVTFCLLAWNQHSPEVLAAGNVRQQVLVLSCNFQVRCG